MKITKHLVRGNETVNMEMSYTMQQNIIFRWRNS